MTTYTPYSENSLTGASLSGSSGETGRTYVLANDNGIAEMMQVIVSSMVLQPSSDFSFDENTNTVTFTNAIFDDQPISISYFVADSTTASGSIYTSVLEMCRVSGIALEVVGENLGTGNGTADSYDLDNGNVIAESYSIKYATSGSNSLNTLTETTDYSINKDMGLIVLTATGKTKCNGKVIYANYMYCPKLSNTILNTFLAPASAEVDSLTGNYWGTNTSTTEYFDGYNDGYPRTDRPFGYDRTLYDYPEFQLKYKGVSSVTPVQFLDFAGDVDSTISTANIKYSAEGRVILNTTIPNGKRNIAITYTHGYSSVPALIQELASLIGGAMALVYISGGSYKDISSYQIGRKQVSLGEVHANISGTMRQIQGRIETILEQVGMRYTFV